MASGSPRTRIDQFFSSRKKKPLSPSVKSGRTAKDARIASNSSPGAKGTLDNFLVNSQDDSSLVRTASADCSASSWQDTVKKKLTLETNLSSEVTRKESLLSPKECGQTGELLGEVSKVTPLVCSKALGISAHASVEDTIGASSPGPDNHELKQFAADFLSLYCREPSSSVNSASDPKLNVHKRLSSPSLIEIEGKSLTKKQCLSTQDRSQLDAKNACSKPGDAMLGHSGEYDISGNIPIEVRGSLRKCNKTPKPNPNMVSCHTPDASTSNACTRETPNSARGSSIFSPGEAFWNEAIQVADGLFAPVGKNSVQVAEETNDISSHNGQKNTCNLRDGLCDVRFKAKFDEGNSKSRHLDLECSLESEKKHAKEIVEYPVVVPDKEVSPLPVKHLDFLHEDRNLNDNSPHQCSTDSGTSITHKDNEQCHSGSIIDKAPESTKILSHSKAQRNGRLTSEGETRSFPVSLNMDLGVPSSTVNRELSHIQDVTTILPEAKNERVLLGQENNSITSCERQKANRCKYDATSTPSSSIPLKDCLDLKNWLPSELCHVYRKRGISKLYPWQVDCLQVDGVLQRRNLVYCASTSAGKSFVAEILMLRRVISTGRMALLVLPYVSICAEKAEHLEVLLETLGKHVRGFYGNQGGGTLPKDTSIAVCTIEKANSLVNRLLEEGRLSEVGIIVIDELHMVGDPHRGYLLELMLTKLRYAAGEGNADSCSGESSGTSSGKADPAHGLQIVGMSATMPNVAAVADWLQAALYQTDFRPVPLEEYIKVGNTIFNKQMDAVRTIPKTANLGGKDPDHIVELCNEVVQEGHSVLLFCSSRKGCESTAKHVAKFLKGFSAGIRDGLTEFTDITSAIDALRRCPVGLDPILEETLPSGVAYHHAGLTVEEREIVETCYRKGLLRVLTATSTLAAGVNLPARRVIFRQPRIGRDFIDGTRYRQMAGRAGRTGIDSKGESVLICKPEEVKRIIAVLNDCCPPLQSCLSEDKNGMTHAILEVVAGGIVQTACDIHRYVRCTLLNSTKPFQDVVKSAQDSLRWLCHRKFLEWNEETKLYSTTPLGRAAFGSSLSPEESLIVLDDLSRAREGFVLASDLHLVYLVTPINVEVEPDWELYYEKFMELSALDQSVGNRVGVVEPFLMRMAHGAPLHISNKSRENRKGPHCSNMLSDEQVLRVCKRFYVALILSRLVQEAPVADVCEAFKVARGMVQALQENAGRFASMVSLFCERLGWHDLEGLVSKFQNRVSFGVRAEIAELTTIPYVKGSRARALYKAGLRTPLAIAEASLPEIVKALFESSSWAAQGSAQRRIQMGAAKKIKNGARKIVLDKAEEARAAAFSAFKSLGLDVPQFSRPFLVATSRGNVQEGGRTSSGDDTGNSIVGVQDITTAPDAIGNQSSDDIAPKIAGQILGRTSHTSVHASVEEVNSVNAMQSASNDGNIGIKIEGSSQSLGINVTANNNHTQNPGVPAPASAKLENAGYNDSTHSWHINHEQQEENRKRGSIGNTADANIYDKGPISASCIPGGFDCFLDLWYTIQEFFFDIHFSKRSDLNSIVPFEIHGMAICWTNSPVYYVNLSKDLPLIDMPTLTRKNEVNSVNETSNVINRWETAKHRWSRIARIMGRGNVRKISWNVKVQIQVLKNPGISIQRFGLSSIQKDVDIEVIDNSYLLMPPIYLQDGIDMSIVSWMLWPDEERSSNPNLEKEVKKRLSSEVAAAANRSGRWKNQMRKAAHNGCCRRVAQIRALGSVLWKLLVSEELSETLTNIENPLVNVLADMELWGIGVDMEGCLRARKVLGKKLKELEKEAYKLAGMTFSLYTAADIANVLYGHLKLPIPEGSSKGKQHPSTDKHSLDLLRHHHPIISVIKEHRTLAKLLNGTLGSICSQARLSVKSRKYTLHGHWLQTSTATGRLSMEEPNLQCVEHSVELKIHRIDKVTSATGSDHHVINARDYFIPTQDNWLLLTADYSQIELRLMAHFSKDSSLIELLSRPNGDVFTMISAKWTGQLESTITSQERDQTKRLVYGILYGMGAKTLAEQLNCSADEAAEKIESFKSSFPGVASWLSEAVASCRQKGYVETLKGRKRFLSKIKLGNSKEKAKAQRQAVNSICQGSAADIIKIAMINIHTVIAEGCEKPNSSFEFAKQFPMLKGHCRILLQVHDELVLEVDPLVIGEAGLLLQLSMENAVSLLVPLQVKLKVGRTWGSLELFQVEQYKEKVLLQHS
ncbi:PREDICTED: helicase and polymerase-containing protein TEBICHI isoform X2 [Nelumbo nucifera]|uniref:Helicase and polymerase-containing protein TEBICHI isoform X2 n=1 Tax=Nelumbo nucifera TaxID=4432 RepID=A0A1U8Q164_NELNU|nr:PREDICTED: helicase and polymerase-containing protein TEBICHI isoform X2 [Nelumbo nucifera]